MFFRAANVSPGGGRSLWGPYRVAMFPGGLFHRSFRQPEFESTSAIDGTGDDD